MTQVWKTRRQKNPAAPMPEQLRNPDEMPWELEYVWEWWLRCFTGDPLTFAELRSWAELSGIRPLPWETELMMTIDRLYWRTQNDQRGSGA